MDNKIEIKNSPIVEARLFPFGVQVTREATVAVPEKSSKLLFLSLPEDIDPQSVSVTVDKAELQSAAYRLDFLTNLSAAPKIVELEKKLEDAKDRLEVTKNKIAVVEFERQILESNRSLSGTHSGVNTNELKTAVDYLKKQFEANRAEGLKLAKNLKDDEEAVCKLQKELGLISPERLPSGQVTAEISAKKAGEVKLTLSYFTRKAAWSPIYEARGTDEEGKVSLKLKGKVCQKTGENWQNIRLIFSTGNPSAAVREPELSPWELRIARPERPRVFAMAAKREASFKFSAQEVESYEEYDTADDSYSTLDASIDENMSATEFVMNDPADLPSDEEKSFEIFSSELSAEFKHFCIPKRDKEVYLLAHIKGWEKLNLLAAPVNVYLGSAFIGSTEIDPSTLKDELKISFGRDVGVIAKRIKGRDFSGKQTFGNNIKTTVLFTIEVKNTKKRPVNITVIDQIPISTNKQITVDAIELSGASINKDKGELTYNLTLKPAEAVTKTVKYAVTYPQDANIGLE